MRYKRRILSLCRVGIFAALLAIASWISIPFPIPVTLQLLILFTMTQIMKLSESVSVTLVYLGLGAVGIPVFTGFQSGFGVILGPTGGFLLGFIPSAVLLSICFSKTQRNTIRFMISLLGLVPIYCFAVVWYTFIYGGKGAFTACVLPFLPFDIIKAAISVPLSVRLKKSFKSFVK